jgi:hypothetical protein
MKQRPRIYYSNEQKAPTDLGLKVRITQLQHMVSAIATYGVTHIRKLN